MKTLTKTAILQELVNMPAALPKSWYKAAGLLRGKRKALEQHTQRVRQEWSTAKT